MNNYPERLAVPFDRDTCVRATVYGFEPPVWPTPARNNCGFVIEQRYLADEYSRQEHLADRLTSVGERVAAAIGGWEDPAVALTPHMTDHLRQEAEMRHRGLGVTLAAHGRVHGVVARLTTAEAMAAFEVNEYALTELDDDWGVFLSARSGEPILLVRTDREEDFEAVALDTLYVADPEAVREPLRAYHTARALAHLTHLAEVGPHLHDSNTPAVIPPALRAIGEVTDSDERELQLLQAVDMVRYMNWVGGSARAIPDDVAYRVRERLGAQVPGVYADKIHTGYSLRHMAECAAESLAGRERAQLLAEVYAWLRAVDFRWQEDALIEPHERAILLQPYSHTLWPARVAAAAEQYDAERAQNDRFRHFAQRAMRMHSAGRVFRAMQRALPETYATVTALRSALGQEGYARRSRFDEVIARSVRPFIGPSMPEGGLRLSQLRARIAGELANQARAVGLELAGLTPHFHGNPHLAFALPLLVAKRAITQLTVRMARATHWEVERVVHERSNWQELERDIIKEYQQRVDRVDNSRRLAQERPAALASFQEAHGITDEELAILQEELVQPADSGRLYELQPRVYTYMFTALYLSKQGVVNFASDFHREIMKLLADSPEQAEAIDRAWQRLAALMQNE